METTTLRQATRSSSPLPTGDFSSLIPMLPLPLPFYLPSPLTQTQKEELSSPPFLPMSRESQFSTSFSLLKAILKVLEASLVKVLVSALPSSLWSLSFIWLTCSHTENSVCETQSSGFTSLSLSNHKIVLLWSFLKP